MNFIISGKNIEVTPGLKDAIEQKLGKLERYFTPETEINVTLSVEKGRQKIEVTIPVKGNIIRSEQVSNDMYVSIDLVEEVSYLLGALVIGELAAVTAAIVHANIAVEVQHSSVRLIIEGAVADFFSLVAHSAKALKIQYLVHTILLSVSLCCWRHTGHQLYQAECMFR